MNRQIKFRAWDYDVIQERYVMRNFESIQNNCGAYFFEPKKYQPNPHILMQFTGLIDKNEKEIYEGDIVKCHYFYYESEKEVVGEISFKDMGLWIETDNEDDSGHLLWITGLHEESFEVIGNIYENPELITQRS